MASVNMTAAQLTLANFSLGEYFDSIKLLLIFVVGIVIYAFFIFKFYRFLARRDILELKLHKHHKGFSGFMERVAALVLYLVENILLAPLLIFFWFAVLSVLLLLLTKSPNPESILLISAALVAAVRITSYYNENLSQDLAKMIPFALLGVFISEVSFTTLAFPLETFKQIPLLWQSLLYYLIFVIMIEVVMRILRTLLGLMIISKVPKKEEE